jgi:hypothetical protein
VVGRRLEDEDDEDDSDTNLTIFNPLHPQNLLHPRPKNSNQTQNPEQTNCTGLSSLKNNNTFTLQPTYRHQYDVENQ